MQGILIRLRLGYLSALEALLPRWLFVTRLQWVVCGAWLCSTPWSHTFALLQLLRKCRGV